LPSAPPPERLQSSRARRPRRYSDEEQYTQLESSEDDEYRPLGRGRNLRRPSVKAVATTAATTAAATKEEGSALSDGAPAVRWERGMVTGPCTNPDCDHPIDSPQWRKGPPQFPILCNACGTRWLRNGTLKPLVPRRGIRYSKPRPRGTTTSRATAPQHSAHEENDGKFPVEHPIVQRSRRSREQAQLAAEPSEELSPCAPYFPAAHSPPLQNVDVQAMGSMPQVPEAFVAAMSSIPGFSMPMFFPPNAHMDPALLQQQMMAMNAAAQAAAQQYMTAMADAAVPPQYEKPVHSGRPIIEINAVAGPAIHAPSFKNCPAAVDDDLDVAMQDA